MLCRPTNVAAANCQALSPVSSHFGDGTSMDLPPIGCYEANPTNTESKKYARQQIPSHAPWNAANSDAYKRGIRNKKRGKDDEGRRKYQSRCLIFTAFLAP